MIVNGEIMDIKVFLQVISLGTIYQIRQIKEQLMHG